MLSLEEFAEMLSAGSFGFGKETHKRSGKLRSVDDRLGRYKWPEIK
jgi:hypothetical protein